MENWIPQILWKINFRSIHYSGKFLFINCMEMQGSTEVHFHNCCGNLNYTWCFFSYQMVWKITKSPAGTIKSSDPTTHLRLKTIMPGIAWYVLQPRASLALFAFAAASASAVLSHPHISIFIHDLQRKWVFLLLIRKYYTYLNFRAKI